MRTPRSERNHIKPYNKPTTDYGEEEANRMAKEDLKNLALCYSMRFDDEDLMFHFPSKDIHGPEYFQIFINHVIEEALYIKNEIEDCAIESLFDSNKIKSFITEVLKYPNNEKGREGLLEAISHGTEIKKEDVRFHEAHNDNIDVIALTNLYDANKNVHLVRTIWRLREDLTLNFVTMDLNVWTSSVKKVG